MSKRLKESNEPMSSSPSSSLLARLDKKDLTGIKVAIKRHNVPETSDPLPIQRSIEDPFSLTVHRKDEGQHPIFQRAGIVVNSEEGLEERIVLKSPVHGDYRRSPSREYSTESRSRSCSRSDKPDVSKDDDINKIEDRYKKPANVYESKSSGDRVRNRDKYNSRSPSPRGRYESQKYYRESLKEKQYEEKFKRNRSRSPVYKSRKQSPPLRPGEYRPPKRTKQHDREISPSPGPSRTHSSREVDNKYARSTRSPNRRRTKSPEAYRRTEREHSPSYQFDRKTKRERSPIKTSGYDRTTESKKRSSTPSKRYSSRSPGKRYSASPPNRKRSRSPGRKYKNSSEREHYSSRYSPRRESYRSPPRRSSRRSPRRDHSPRRDGYRSSPDRKEDYRRSPKRPKYGRSRNRSKSPGERGYRGSRDYPYFDAEEYWIPNPLPHPGFIPRGFIPPVPRGMPRTHLMPRSMIPFPFPHPMFRSRPPIVYNQPYRPRVFPATTTSSSEAILDVPVTVTTAAIQSTCTVSADSENGIKITASRSKTDSVTIEEINESGDNSTPQKKESDDGPSVQ